MNDFSRSTSPAAWEGSKHGPFPRAENLRKHAQTPVRLKGFRMLCDMSGNLMILAHSASMDRWIRDQRSVSRQVSVTSSGRMCLYLLFRHTSQTPELIWPEDG